MIKFLSEISSDKAVVINCLGVHALGDHAADDLAQEVAGRKATTLFANAQAIQERLAGTLGPPLARYEIRGGASLIYSLDPGRDAALQLVQTARDTEDASARQWVASSFEAFSGGSPRRLASTPLLSYGVFNSRKLISTPLIFTYLSLLLAQELEEVLEKLTPRSPRLLAVSLRSSPFAVAARQLARQWLPLEIVNHLGPCQNIFRDHDLENHSAGGDYILVGDFVVGGTELKVAQSYARLRGGELKAAVVIGTQLEPTDYGLQLEIRRLVSLHEIRPKTKFWFQGEDPE